MLLILLAMSVTATFAVGFALLAKRLKLQWFLSDMYFVIALSVLVLGPELRYFSHPQLVTRDILITVLNCVGAEIPILFGTLWGLACAQRATELRIFFRYLFMFSCAASIYGVMGIAHCFVVSVGTLLRLGPGTAILVERVPLSLLLLSILLLVPGLIVHLKSRHKR